jgi:glycosyltransferase involved in cell wall biosynthesis
MHGRIGLIVYDSLDLASGGYLYDRQLVAALRAHGWHVDVFPLPSHSYALGLLDNVRPGLEGIIERAGLDVLLEDELCHPSLLELNRRLKLRLGLPVISVVHHLRASERHPTWQSWLSRRVERAYLRGVDGFIFNSQATAHSVEHLAGRYRASVVAWPSGAQLHPNIEPRAVESRAHTAPPLRIVFLGNVIQRKGLETLIDAVAMLPPKEWRLTVVGDLELDARLTYRLRRRIRARALHNPIWLTGRLRDDDVASILSTSHVMAVPSSYEGFGIAYLDGMSFGLPAIGTATGGAAEIITSGVDGWLVQPGDVRTLSTRLLELVRNRELLIRMSHAALERAGRHPSWMQSMTRAVDFIECAASGRRFRTGPAPPAAQLQS